MEVPQKAFQQNCNVSNVEELSSSDGLGGMDSWPRSLGGLSHYREGDELKRLSNKAHKKQLR